MIDFKEEIADIVAKATGRENEEIKRYIEVPKEVKNGDYAFPCFRLAKVLKKAPLVIAQEIKEKIEFEGIKNDSIKQIEIAGGYLNFYINKNIITQNVINEIAYEKEYGKDQLELPKLVNEEYKEKRIYIVDDIYATGNTMKAIKETIEELGGIVAGEGVIMNIVEYNFLELYKFI